ncbi:formate-nitrite transporter [Hepatocystis sp. ex Piliocolobus tephrosceles]|nr:formate-nitrite transporter [Hepatocystis sp. ex Piliocolobus tephrosceles]
MNKTHVNSVVDPLCIRVSCTSVESYIRCVEYGKGKANVKVLYLLLRSILAGIFVGLCAHAATVAGGLFYFHKLREYVGISMSLFVYGFTFPIAFLSIVCTGADLFTGNTLAVTTAMLQRKISIIQYARIMATSLLGNYIGATFFAFFISYASGVFKEYDDVSKNHLFQFLNDIAVKKVSHNYISCIALAIGCNLFVCLALYFIISIKDGSGIIFGAFFAVYAFAIAGYEHIIANIYTLNIALMANTKVTFYEVYIKNLIPTLIGNCIAGIVFLAIPLFILYRKNYDQYENGEKEKNETVMKSISIENSLNEH